ncbi:MAG: phage holin family protein [Lachnospira sp.]
MVKSSNDLVNGTFAVVVGDLFSNGVQHSMPWLVAMTLVVVVDLLTGLRKCWMIGEPIRWSKGYRATLSKLVCYWAFACGAVMVQEACDNAYPIAMWACLSVIAIEGVSIVGNILKPHGVDINIVNLIKAIGKKHDVDLDKVVTKKKKVGGK